MTDCETDPRLPAEQRRTISGANGTITLVGVVHDHPASRYRASQVVGDRDPAVLALELPPLAVSLFVQYARDDRSPPVFGGEMSAAIQAANTDRIVGIDGPTPKFVGRLAKTLYRTDASRETTRRVFSGVFSATRQAVTCKVASVLASTTSIRLEVDTPTTYETDWTDPPEQQAADERRQLRRARSVLDVFESSRATELRDETREAHMADNLEHLSHEGDVVAIVGQDHLDPIASRLADES